MLKLFCCRLRRYVCVKDKRVMALGKWVVYASYVLSCFRDKAFFIPFPNGFNIMRLCRERMIDNMKEQLEAIRSEAAAVLAAVRDAKALDTLRVKYLGKKGALTAILKQMGKLSAEERPVMGQLANEVRSAIENAISEKQIEIAKLETEARLASETIDITLPGKKQSLGSLHPLSIVENEIKEIFLGMGFEIADGPEVEYDYYNFEALNLPPDHPARDTQDTFYITDNILLRTQTSSVQVHVMENKKPPIRVISPGRVFRSDAVDATHSLFFIRLRDLLLTRVLQWLTSRVLLRCL